MHCNSIMRLSPFSMFSFYEWMCQLAQKNQNKIEKEKKLNREKRQAKKVLVLKKSVKTASKV